MRVGIEAETEHGEQLLRFWRHEGTLSDAAVADRVRWQLDGWLNGPAANRPSGGITRLALIPDELIAAKAKASHEAGLKPIVCVGEQLEERESGNTENVVGTQVRGSLAGLTTEEMLGTVIAYEPVWAIGTGEAATPEQAQETHKGIRDWIAANVDRATADAIRIQYGGSANAGNAPELSSFPDIDGFLVGGASLKPTFMDIVSAAGKKYASAA